jgi:class 3 adenylate cyclase
VPFHILSVIKNEKRQVDEFEQVTLLYTNIVKFTEFTNQFMDPREAVSVLNKIFMRFDQLCEEYKVYKVHTVGDCYVVMGYNGRIEKSKRTKSV